MSWLKNIKWWILYRIHSRYQYHIIRTGLEPNYWDEDTLILHGCMAMLERYIKSMGGKESLERFNAELRSDPENWGAENLDRQAQRQEKALAIYRWWKYQKPRDEKELDRILISEDPSDKWGEFREKLYNDEQEMLHQLIDIRRSLWT